MHLCSLITHVKLCWGRWYQAFCSEQLRAGGALNYVLNTHRFITQSYEKIKAFNLRNNEASSATWRAVLTRQLAVELCSKEKHLQGAWPCCGEVFLYVGDSVLTRVGVGKGRQGHSSASRAHMVCIHTHPPSFLGAFPVPAPLHEHKMLLCSRDPRAAAPHVG